MDTQVLIVGGGLSGLTTAFRLKQAGLDVLVLERDAIAGGCIKTDRQDGYMMEQGPNSLLVNRQQVLDFIDEIGLSGELVESNSAANNRYIVKDGRLHTLPSSPISFLRTSLFSLRDKLAIFREPFIGRGSEDETIAQFARRRLGNGFYDYAINPFVSGVYAGDPEELLARAAIRKVWLLEKNHGSMIRGGLAMMMGKGKPEGRIKGRLLSFKQGMSSLPLNLAEKLGDSLETGVQITELTRTEKGWRVSAGERSWTAAHLVLAVPAHAAAKLLSPLSQPATTALEQIPYAPVAVAHLAYHRADVGFSLNGFGCLIPRKEGITTLGGLFSSTLFSDRTQDPNQVLLTCFLGGATRPEIRDWSDAEVLDQVQKDLTPLLDLKGPLVMSHLVRWAQGIPQYTRGHFRRLAKVEQALLELGQISMRANWRDGVSVPDCIQNATLHAAELVKKLKV